MEPGQAVQLEYILGHISVGVAILDATNLRLLYVNSYLHSLLEDPWKHQDVVGYRVDEITPEAVHRVALPLLRQTATTRQRLVYAEVPYEGFLETRGRTYWRICIELLPAQSPQTAHIQKQDTEQQLLISIEDVTDSVRSRLYLNAIHHISSAIADASALPLVLDRILQALQEMVGSKRCAVFLTEQSVPGPETRNFSYEEVQRARSDNPLIAIVAAHKGVHSCSQDWHPLVNERILLGRIIQKRSTMIIPDTNALPDVDLPFLNDHGTPYRPGSVLCVPIFDSYSAYSESIVHAYNGPKRQSSMNVLKAATKV